MHRLLTVSIVIIFLLMGASTISAQLPYNLMDGRKHKYCEACDETIRNMPKEVLFGIHIQSNGDIYFSMSDKQWFEKIFKSNAYGVSVDLVSKDKYSCMKENDENYTLPRGTITFPVYRDDLIKGMENLSTGTVFVKIGKVPDALKKKELEGNLAIVNGNLICFYTNFVNIDRSIWQLLPMGLYTDSLVQETQNGNIDPGDFYTYNKKVQLVISFKKGITSFNSEDLSNFNDSIELGKYHIRKIDIRAYSSVEGSEKFNEDLM